MSEQLVIVNKPIGKTPLEMVQFFKKNNPEYAESTISYAGRLDPMAHGLLILLIGGVCWCRLRSKPFIFRSHTRSTSVSLEAFLVGV